MIGGNKMLIREQREIIEKFFEEFLNSYTFKKTIMQIAPCRYFDRCINILTIFLREKYGDMGMRHIMQHECHHEFVKRLLTSHMKCQYGFKKKYFLRDKPMSEYFWLSKSNEKQP